MKGMAVYTSRNILICAVPAVVAIMTIIWYRRRKKRATEVIQNQKINACHGIENNSSIQKTKGSCDGSEMKLSTCSPSDDAAEPAISLETSVGAFIMPSKNDINIFEVQLHEKSIFEVQESSESKCSITMVPENVDGLVETSKLDNQLQPIICETDNSCQERNETNMIKLPDVICDESLSVTSSVSNSNSSRTNNEAIVRINSNIISARNDITVGESDDNDCQNISLKEVTEKEISKMEETLECTSDLQSEDVHSENVLIKSEENSHDSKEETIDHSSKCIEHTFSEKNVTLVSDIPETENTIVTDELESKNIDIGDNVDKLHQDKDDKLSHDTDDKLGKGDKLGRDKGDKLGHDNDDKLGHDKDDKLGHDKDDKLGHDKDDKLDHDKDDKLDHDKEDKLGHDKDDKLSQNLNSMQQAGMDESGNNSSQGQYSDIHSEESSDSGKGGSDIQLSTEYTHFPMSDDGLTVYEFELPQDLCGRLIGRQGKSVNYIKNHSNANVFIKKHPVNPRMKLCTIEGNGLEIGAALELIRRRFPPSHFPNVTLAQFNTNGNARGLPIPETLQLSWLNQSCLLFQKKLLPFHSHFQNASVYHHITEIQLHLPEAVSCDVIMSSMVTAGHFFLQQPTHPTYTNLNRLDNCMVACYTQMETPQLPRPVEAGVICAAPVMSGWYRAQVVYVCESMEECDVKFVDYGGYSRVPISSLRQIRSDFMTLPFQASECYLANVQSLDEDGSWSVEACATFEELAQGHILQAQIVGYADDSIPFVHLYKLQGISTLFINRELVNRGVAQWIEHQ